jgi:hypothetical protein
VVEESKRLLLIEADPGLHKRLTSMLERAGYQVAHGDVASGARSLGRIDAVVLCLPVSPAWSLADLPTAPLVLLHSRAMFGELERWLDPPHPCPRILLSRPFRCSELREAVERACESWAPGEEPHEPRS